MELLNQLRREGFILKVLDNNRLAVMPKEKLNAELRERIRNNKEIIIKALKHQTKNDESPSQGQGRKFDPEPSAGPICENSKWCQGYQPARWVHPEVCKWHLEEADLKCLGCPHVSARDKEIWMDSYLDRAINRLNQLYQAHDTISWRKRHEVNNLEKKITELFLIHDVEGFKRAVDEWEALFKEMQIHTT